MASTSMVVGVSAVFLGALVAGFLVPDSLNWLSRLQTVSISASSDADDDLIRLETAHEDKLDEIDERQARR
jgi:hypothetical protein